MATINRFPQMAQALHEAVAQAVRKVALDVEAAAKQGAPVDTGFLKNSVYSVTADSSDYSADGVDALPQVDAPPDDQTAYVAVGASYGIYAELGTSRMAAQPFMAPAAASVEQGMAQGIAALIAAKLKSLAI